ncbi:hypothetical protein UFOVP785_93 [uncultured Caudovirales phage]|uniref:Uncharacterized protein n=1 Tax=uncultured Caudovirales phage TaxID=2100421 RepID=A0A6J5P017_9CAUD|nr:hypothetical protein UFOVP785_93 [uncultured Caudovirales phage]
MDVITIAAILYFSLCFLGFVLVPYLLKDQPCEP